MLFPRGSLGLQSFRLLEFSGRRIGTMMGLRKKGGKHQAK